MDGDSLEAALRDYGPAAIEDLLPRLLVIARTLDQAHAAGRIHGTLHPQHIFVSAETTRVAGLDQTAAAESPVRPPFAAPEVVSGGVTVAASDQFALAAIAFEWLFGRRISGPAVRPVGVRTLPGVDRDAMAAAFSRALAPDAADRFASCTAFCHALAASVLPVLPLGNAGADDDVLDTAFLPESDSPALAEPSPANVDPDLTADEPRLVAFEPRSSPPVEPVPSWQPGAVYAPAKPAERFGGGALIAALLVGMVAGFAAGYMARPRALQGGPMQSMVTPSNGTDGAVPAPPAPTASASARSESGELRRDPAGAASGREGGSQAPSSAGRLLVRTTPSGASVEVDGVVRGVTPLALRDLELGSRTIAVARRGYIAEERRIVLTRARPSRSVEIRLTTAATAAPRSAGEPSTPATLGRRPAAVSTGSLLIESRPAGAAVTIDGRSRGATPLTIADLAPGDYRISLLLAGYQPFATTVRVVAGERTRAAASLSAQE